MITNHKDFRAEVAALLVKYGYVGKSEPIDSTVDIYAGKIVITLNDDMDSVRAICAEIDTKYEAPYLMEEWL